jgi:hypothetical protein
MNRATLPSGLAVLATGLLLACAAQGGAETSSPDAPEDVAPEGGDVADAEVGNPMDAVEVAETSQDPIHVALAHNSLWVALDAGLDPYSLAAEDTRCGPDDVSVETVGESLWFEVLTDGCSHTTHRQATLASLGAGDTLLVWLWHYAMEHEGGDFTARVALGEPPETVWETTLPVPAESGLIYEEVTVEASWPTGTPIWFHLSNHGANTWSLVELARLDAP